MHLGLWNDLSEHPLAALREAGVRVTINTDDPAAQGMRLESEWAVCAATFGWGLADMRDFARTSIAACFAPEELKAALRAELDPVTAG
jgi:adenosine deaminase